MQLAHLGRLKTEMVTPPFRGPGTIKTRNEIHSYRFYEERDEEEDDFAQTSGKQTRKATPVVVLSKCSKLALSVCSVTSRVSTFEGRRIYLCGNPEMVRSLRKTVFLNGAGIKEIHSDAFLAAPAKAS
jgi:ferredoxin-NADP reductase